MLFCASPSIVFSSNYEIAAKPEVAQSALSNIDSRKQILKLNFSLRPNRPNAMSSTTNQKSGQLFLMTIFRNISKITGR